MNKRIGLLLLAISATAPNLHAKTIKALFIGNSYTESNNLPEIIRQIALTQGDTLVYEKSTPGGYKFMQHVTNTTSLNLINRGDWDFVVLQEQSQLPSFPDPDVINQVYPHATTLSAMIKDKNPCAQPVFYMTWGRKNGDQSNCNFFPPLCTYVGMDSLLQLRYTNMAEQNNSVLSPVAKVWRSIRNNHSSIELYTGDESHPSFLGSYAAAATFYAILFKKDPTLTTYMSNNTATATINQVAKEIVFDSLNTWYRFTTLQQAKFTHSTANNITNFNNLSTGFHTYEWQFGDGNSSISDQPNHTYSAAGTYQVILTATDTVCNKVEIIKDSITIDDESVNIETISQNKFSIYPNPATDRLTVKLEQGNVDKIIITDLTGKQLLKTGIKNQEQLIDISPLTKGIYVISIYQNDKIVYNSKFSKL